MKGKTPGPNNVTIDLIEAAGELIYERLATLFNECLRQSKIPEKWDETIIILLHKKGDQKDIKLPSDQSSQQYLQAGHKDHHEPHYTNSRWKPTKRTSWLQKRILHNRPPTRSQPTNWKMCRIQNTISCDLCRLHQSFWFRQNQTFWKLFKNKESIQFTSTSSNTSINKPNHSSGYTKTLSHSILDEECAKETRAHQNSSRPASRKFSKNYGGKTVALESMANSSVIFDSLTISSSLRAAARNYKECYEN